jgi:phage/plasmid-associated DNA primase
MSVDKALKDSGATRKNGKRHGSKSPRSKEETSLYVPGPIRIVESLTQKYRFRTIPETGTDKEKVFYFNGQIYERTEELIKSEAHTEYARQWAEQLESSIAAEDKNHAAKMKSMLDRGPSANDINEVLQMIRRTTFTYDEMNPVTHIPFLNGLLNLKTRAMEPFTADLFFTYQINANLLNRHVTLRDVPLFNSLLNSVFYEPDVPMALSYGAYAFRPDFPVHKVLFILGRERVGKGTFVRVLQGLMTKGSGSLSLARLLAGERFQFTGIEGMNLLVDSETKRKFRRGTVLDWSMFCNLFGGDTLSIEPKGRDAHDYVSKAKGIVLGNLPFLQVDSPPAIARVLIVETRNERPKRVIPNLDKKILTSEGDLIATLLIQIMFKLEDREFMFPGQLTDDATTDILEQLADPISNFVDEMTEYQEGINTSADDAVAAFIEWCDSKGIPPLKPQVFKRGFGKHYEKRRLGPRGAQDYFYMNCRIFDIEDRPNVQSQIQVGYGDGASKTQKTSLSGDRYRRIQHECTNPRVRREEDQSHDHDVKGDTLMLDTDKNCIGEPKITAPGEQEPVSNLNREISPDNYSSITDLTAGPLKSDAASETDHDLPMIENSPKTHDPGHMTESNANPVKSDVQSQKNPITENEGKLIIKQLLNLGYHLDLDSGPNIDRKYFKIGVLGLRSLPPDKQEKLEHVMQQEGFVLSNTGVFGIWWFSRPLKWGEGP